MPELQSRSRAERERDHLRRNFPLDAPPDHAELVFGMHPARTQARLAMALAGGPLALAEVGSTAPNAYTHCFEDRSRLVVLNTGLVDFVGAVAATLFGNTTLFVGADTPVPASLSAEQAADCLAALYRAWQSGALWAGKKLAARPVVSSGGAGFAEMLGAASLLFILSHELGHAVLHAELLGDDDAEALTPEQELEADEFGIRLLMAGWADSGPQKNWRWGAAGITVALRMLSALERLGHRFPGNHPPPEARLHQLRRVLGDLAGSEEAYFHITPLATGFEEVMDVSEHILLGTGRVAAETTVERAVSGVMAILEAAGKGQKSDWQALADARARLETATAAVLAEAGQTVGRILGPRSPWFSQDESRRTMWATLLRLQPDLPEAFHLDKRS